MTSYLKVVAYMVLARMNPALPPLAVSMPAARTWIWLVAAAARWLQIGETAVQKAALELLEESSAMRWRLEEPPEQYRVYLALGSGRRYSQDCGGRRWRVFERLANALTNSESQPSWNTDHWYFGYAAERRAELWAIAYPLTASAIHAAFRVMEATNPITSEYGMGTYEPTVAAVQLFAEGFIPAATAAAEVEWEIRPLEARIAETAAEEEEAAQDAAAWDDWEWRQYDSAG